MEVNMEVIICIIIGYIAYKKYKEYKRKQDYKKYKEYKRKQDYKNDIIWYNNNFPEIEIDFNKLEQPQIELNPKDYIDTAKSPFLIVNSLLTKAEMNFYQVLKNVIDNEKQIICPKVRMIDVLWTKTYRVENKLTFINKVNRKHFDFVICDKETLKPIMAIELDDKSHEEEARKERDEFVDALFTDLNFKVIHIPVQYSYNANEIKEKIDISQTTI